MIFELKSTWDSLIVLFIVFSPFLIYCACVTCRKYVEKDKSKWETIRATLTGKMDKYEDRVGGSYILLNVDYLTKKKLYKSYQIEYIVDGKKYVKYITEEEAKGKKHGHVRIMYLKKRPSRFKVL